MRLRLEGLYKLTRNERSLYLWLKENSSVAGRIRCSAGKVGLKFNWSDTQSARVLSRLEDKGIIELIQKGQGRKPNLYRVYIIPTQNIILVGKKQRKIKLTEEDNSLVSAIRASRTPFQVQSTTFLYSNGVNLNPNQKISLKMTAQKPEGFLHDSNNTHSNISSIRRSKLLLSHIRTPPVKNTKLGNFKRFAEKYLDPEKWNAIDVVCYYALLSESVRGVRPKINWKVEVGAAKNLLNRYEDGGISVKRLLQLGFWITPEYKSPESLTWFTQHWVINKCEENWDHDLSAPELDDRWVFAKLS